jgi:hypothetical protein
MRVAPSRATVARGRTVRVTVTFRALGAFKGPVTLSTAGLRTGETVVYARNPTPATGSVVITVRTARTDARGSHMLRITGVRGALRHAVMIRLSIA